MTYRDHKQLEQKLIETVREQLSLIRSSQPQPGIIDLRLTHTTTHPDTEVTHYYHVNTELVELSDGSWVVEEQKEWVERDDQHKPGGSDNET